MSPYLKLLLFITGIVVIINIVVVIKKMIPLIKRLNEIKRLKRNFNVIKCLRRDNTDYTRKA